MTNKKWLTVMGSFVADLAFRTPELPVWGQTMMGSDFRLGPGGKGSNQAVAAARLLNNITSSGVRVSFISKLGLDPFGDLARNTYKNESIDTQFCFDTADHPTGAASIVVHETKGENAIVVVPGACFHLTTEEIDRATKLISDSSIFLTQLEVPVAIVEHGLKIAKSANVPTILNPAPATKLPNSIYPLCDYITPNETEAAMLTGRSVEGIADAELAANRFLELGVKNVVITLGAQGALVKNSKVTIHVPSFNAGPVLETTGAGDAFNGAFAVALSEGMDIVQATRFGCAAAGISVTRYGTAPSMAKRFEVDTLLLKK
ncbi:MAG: ribokinase [Oligoflexia bacterium]|nr:ribokinase [Oligoflexia bacterium]